MTNLFGHSVRSELLMLYLAESLICFLAFYLILRVGLPADLPIEHWALLAVAGVLSLCVGFASGATGLYQPSTWLQASRLIGGTVLGGILLLLTASFVLPFLVPSLARNAWVGHAELAAAFIGAVLATRAAFMYAMQSGLLRRRIAVVPGPGTDALRSMLRDDPIFQVAAEWPAQLEARGFATLVGRLKALRLDAVVADGAGSLSPAARMAIGAAGIKLWDATDFAERKLGRVDLDRLPGDWLTRASGVRFGPLHAALRRGIDILLALILLAVTLPLSLLTMLAIKLDTPGPIFYRQQRVGLGGRVFTLFKFRSMTPTAEQAGAVWASKDDPRITRVGRWIRKTRIDEIPQVFNVLRGDMAFVGPRPERPEFVARLAEIIPHYNDRAAVRPGITGWAQVNFPYGASDEDSRVKLTYDLYYVRRVSLFLDLLILVATVRVIIYQEGAR